MAGRPKSAKKYTMPDGKVVTAVSLSVMLGMSVDTIRSRLNKYGGNWEAICYPGNLAPSILRKMGIQHAAEKYEFEDGRMLTITQIGKILGFPYGKTRNRLESYPGNWPVIKHPGKLTAATMKSFGITTNTGGKGIAGDWKGLKGNKGDRDRQVKALEAIKEGSHDHIEGPTHDCFDCADWTQRS